MRQINTLILGLVSFTSLVISAGYLGSALAEGAAEISTPNLTGVTTLEVKTLNGQIKITRGKTARVSITKRGNVEVKQTQQAGKFSIIAKQKSLACIKCEVSTEIQLPTAMRLKLETSNGEVNILGAALDVQVSTSNAGITVRDAGKTDLNLETSNGAVNVTNVTGKTIINTSNANVELQNLEGSIQMDTSNGEVTLEGIRFRQGSKNTVSTSQGSIQSKRLLVPDGFEIKGSTSNAKISVNLPTFEVKLEDTEFSAIKKGGSGDAGSLSLETSNGEIRLEP
jgi:DUF4097 and DUF4098 domain-containing protein YvlB